MGGKAEIFPTASSLLQESLGSLLMLSEPSESLEGSPNRSIFNIRGGAGKESGVLTSIGDRDEKQPDDDELWIEKRITRSSKSRLSNLKTYQTGLLHWNFPEKKKKKNPPTNRQMPAQDDQVVGNRECLEHSVERVWMWPGPGRNCPVDAYLWR